MASIIRINESLGGPVNLNGYLPSLGVAGYTDRRRASNLPGNVGDSLLATDVWANEVGTGTLAVKQVSTSVTPKLELLGNTEVVAFPIGNQVGFTGGNQQVGNRTIAMLVGGANLGAGARRWIVNYNGFAIASTDSGWVVTTRSVGVNPSDKATITGATPASGQRYVLILSSDTSGNIRFRVKRGTEAPLTATTAAAARGNDLEYKLGAVVYNGTAGSHQIGHIATWDRILTATEEDTVLSSMIGL